jgi:hypothetical protein
MNPPSSGSAGFVSPHTLPDATLGLTDKFFKNFSQKKLSLSVGQIPRRIRKVVRGEEVNCRSKEMDSHG